MASDLEECARRSLLIATKDFLGSDALSRGSHDMSSVTDIIPTSNMVPIIPTSNMVPNCFNCFIMSAQCQLLEAQVELLKNELNNMILLRNTYVNPFVPDIVQSVQSSSTISLLSIPDAINNIDQLERELVEYEKTVYDMDHDVDEVSHHKNTTDAEITVTNTVSCDNSVPRYYCTDDSETSSLANYHSDVSCENLDISYEDITESDCSIPDNQGDEGPFRELNGLPFNLFSADELSKSTIFRVLKNREAAYYGPYSYEYGGIKHNPRKISDNPYLNKICSYLNVVLPNYKYNSALVHRYKNGSSYMPFHSDSEECIVSGSEIVTVSLGATRTMVFTNKQGKQLGSVMLDHGRVLVMTQSSQNMFKHSVVAEEQCRNTRLSITFRLIKPSPDTITNHANVDRLSQESGYVPYNRIHQQKTITSVPSQRQSTNQQTPATAAPSKTVYVSSSMFRQLHAEKMSSQAQQATVFSYSGAHAALMHKKLRDDYRFISLDPTSVKRVFVLTGTNNIESIYYGSRKLADAKRDISDLLQFLKKHFPLASVNVINILPRTAKAKNDIIGELNSHIKKMCEKDHSMSYVDTETENNLFRDKFGVRRENFFVQSEKFPDNVHMNTPGIVRLGRHLKHLAHLDSCD